MQPIKSNIATTGKCLNPVTTKCVIWDGPDITCLDGTTLCKGQSVETTLYTLATKLCEIYTALSLEDINVCINGINDGTSVSIGSTSSIQEVFSAIIKKVCTLNDRVVELENSPCLDQKAIVPACLRTQAANYPSYDATNFTLPLQYYAELVANSVCGILIDITALQNNANNINQQIDDLWSALETCSSTSQNYVLPTCTYNWSVSPDGDPVSVQTAFSWLEADYCTLRGLLGSNTELTTAINSQCPALGSENTLAPGLGGTLNSLPSWVDNPTTMADSITNMWLTVCDMRSYIADVLSLCCKSMCDYLQVAFVPVWNDDGTTVKINFIDNTNPTTYEDGAVPPAPTSPWAANGFALPAWALTQFPTASQTNIQFLVDDGNGNTFNLNTNHTINFYAQSLNQYTIDFTAAGVPAAYDQTSINQTINISFTYDVIINGTTKTCTFDQTLGLPYICNAPKPYNCNGEIKVTSTSGTDMQVLIPALVEETGTLHTGTATGPGSGLDTLEDTVGFLTSSAGFVVTVTHLSGDIECRHVIAVLPGNHEIQVDSDWTYPIVAGDTYVVKDHYYDYATNWSPSSYIPTALTGFNIYVCTSDPSFDINDQNTWQLIVQANNVSPIIACQGVGQVWGDDTFQGNTEYIVVVEAVYKCGTSDPVSTTILNQIAASVMLQVGTPPNLLFNVFDAAQTYVKVEQVLSNGVALANKFSQIGNPAKYALDLPTIGTTQLGLTPLPAVWQAAAFGQPNAFSKCGICVDPAGSTVVGSLSIPNHDATIGTYSGYSVELFELDQYGTVYIPLLDQSSPPKPYKTNSLIDPTLQFSSNSPSGTPVLYNVPLLFPYNKLPLVVRYDPSNFKINNSPNFHKITFTNFLANLVSVPAGATPTPPVWGSFRVYVRIETFKWDTVNNVYIPYSPANYMDTYVIFSAGSGIGSFFQSTSAIINNNNPGATNQELLCTYGDAYRILIYTHGPYPEMYGPICLSNPFGCSYQNSGGLITVTPDDSSGVCAATYPSGCSNITNTSPSTVPCPTGSSLSGCLAIYNSNGYQITTRAQGIITEDITITNLRHSLTIGSSAVC